MVADAPEPIAFVSQSARAMFVLGGVVVVGGIVGGVIGLASGSGFGLAGLVLAAYAGWRIGWTGYRLEVVGDDVVWRAPLVQFTHPRGEVHGTRSGAFDLNIVSIEVGVDGALAFWRSAGLQAFLDDVVARGRSS